VRDNVTHTLERIGAGVGAQIDDSGRVVAFIHGNTMFVRDRVTGTTEVVGPAWGLVFDLSGDGRYVSFAPAPGQASLYDRVTHATEEVGPDITGGAKWFPTVSNDGRFVAFEYDTSQGSVYVEDRTTHVSVAIPLPPAWMPPPATLDIGSPKISGDGRVVAYLAVQQFVTDFPPPPEIHYSLGEFVYDRVTGTTECVSVSSSGVPMEPPRGNMYAISDDGRYVMFMADGILWDSSTLGDHIFVRDRTLARTYLVDRNAFGVIGPGSTPGAGDIAADGSFVAWVSGDTGFVPDDTNGVDDVFVRAFPGAPVPPPVP
jgi:hypothetical protein